MKTLLPKLVTLSLAYLLMACGVASPPPKPVEGGAGGQDLVAILAVSDLAIGENRLAFALLAPNQTEVRGAQVEAHFFYLGEEEAQARGRAAAAYQSIRIPIPHMHQDGTVHDHEDVRGVYVIPRVAFDTAGPWGAVLRVRLPEVANLVETRLTFPVSSHSATPGIGEPAPPGDTPVAHTPGELEQLCSRVPPDSMHSLSVTDALQRGTPFVLAFASPSFCQSRLCGPVTDLVYSLAPEFQDVVAFLHVEPYDLETVRGGGGLEVTTTAQAWGLQSEPWVFVVAADGTIAAKFEGMFSAEELRSAVEALINQVDFATSTPPEG